MPQKCLTCGGVFEPQISDGTPYFHACPPLSYAELTAAVASGAIVLAAGDTVDTLFSRRVFERPAKRDENRPSTRPEDQGKVKAAGKGVTDVKP